MPKPAPKKEAAPELKKLFGSEGYGSYPNLREFARKVPYLSKENVLPGTIKKLTKNERVAIVEELRKRAEQITKQPSSTLSEKTYRERIAPQIKKELSKIFQKTGTTESREYKELARKRQLWEEWMKGIPK